MNWEIKTNNFTQPYDAELCPEACVRKKATWFNTLRGFVGSDEKGNYLH
jgi:hypothetical protein